MDYGGYESETKGKRKQHCTYCKNHGKKSRKTNHKCEHDTCECLLCKLTRLSRLIMRHQQRLWRHLKDSKRREDAAGGASASAAASGGGAAAAGDPAAANGGAGSTKQQKCDMCRNHGEITSKRAHKNACPYQNCNCALCNLTKKRRDIMRHQQRVRRSQVTSKQHNEAWQYVIQAELEFLNFQPGASATPHENHPASSSASTSPSPVSSSSTPGYASCKSEVVSSAPVTPSTPVATTRNLSASVTPELPPLEPLPDCSPRRYSPILTDHVPIVASRPETLTPPALVPPSITVKDIPVMEAEHTWRNLKREREEGLKWSPKLPIREENLLGNLDFMRGHHSRAGRFEPSIPMEGINIHDSITSMDFSSNHVSPFKSLMPMIDASRLPPTPMKKTRTDENLYWHYNHNMLWNNIPVEPRVSFIPEDLQQQCYTRALMNSSTDIRMRSPPGLIPIPQPLRPRPMAPLRPHALPTSMELDHVNLHYLACILQHRGHYGDAMPMAGPFGLPREPSFLHPSVP